MTEMIKTPPGEEFDDSVLLVGASKAIHDYEEYAAYICPANRFSRPSTRMAFYYQSKVDKRVPLILGYVPSVLGSLQLEREASLSIIPIRGSADELLKRMLDLFRKMKDKSDPRLLKKHKFVLLSEESDHRTILLPNEIRNDKLSKSRKPIRFVQSQRYVSLKTLRSSERTTQLEEWPILL